jgi:hypothetical protein
LGRLRLEPRTRRRRRRRRVDAISAWQRPPPHSQGRRRRQWRRRRRRQCRPRCLLRLAAGGGAGEGPRRRCSRGSSQRRCPARLRRYPYKQRRPKKLPRVLRPSLRCGRLPAALGRWLVGAALGRWLVGAALESALSLVALQRGLSVALGRCWDLKLRRLCRLWQAWVKPNHKGYLHSTMRADH